MLSTCIKIHIDQLFPIIHLCSGGSIVTKHKWLSSCLMSMIIIWAICQGLAEHLMWTQHQAARALCLPLTNLPNWHSLHSLFAPLSLYVCPFLSFLISAIAPKHTYTVLFPLAPNPHPYPVHSIMSSRSWGKCHYGNRGTGSGGLSIGERGERDGVRKKWENEWPVAAVESTTGRLTQITLKAR